MVADTKHAVGIKTKEGLEILVHMGIDTVALGGSGFEVFVKEGDTINKDTKIASMDLDLIKKEGKETDIMVIVTNSEEITGIALKEEKEVKAREGVGTINKK